MKASKCQLCLGLIKDNALTRSVSRVTYLTNRFNHQHLPPITREGEQLMRLFPATDLCIGAREFTRRTLQMLPLGLMLI